MAFTADKARQGSAGGGVDNLEIENSLRFNDDDSAYLSRTPTTAGNRKTWTWSGWVKRGNITQHSVMFSADTDRTVLRFSSNDGLKFAEFGYGGAENTWAIEDTRVFRDPSAWYHIVASVDTAQATTSERAKLYVNGVPVTDGSYPDQHQVTSINNTVQHLVGQRMQYPSGALGQVFDGYLAEVNFIDGQALTPSSFGQSGDYGEWNAIKYTGTYGTNGFHLDFKTSGTLGNDANGSNNWTTNNISSSDQMIDTPTNNFPTLNFLDKSGVTLSEGNLKQVHGSAYGGVRASMAFPSSGKWYVEYVENSTAGSNVIGTFSPKGGSDNIGTNGSNQFVYWGSSGSMYTSGTSNWQPSLSIGSGQVLQMAYDSDTGKTWIGVNNVWRRGYANSVLTDGNPSAGTNPTGTWADYTEDTFCTIFSYGLNGVMNFGQDSSFAGTKTAQGNQDGNAIGDFYYTPPSGFLALCSANLPSVTVIPSKHFNTVTYSGDSNSRDITGVGFQPDFTWIKQRGTIARRHHLQDSVRGAGKSLFSNDQTAEETSANYLTSFNTDGFSLGTSSETNGNSHTYVAWNWKAGGTAVSNTSGSITSSVSANVDAGFSIIQHSGNATANATYGHGLSKAPEIVISKKREDNGYIWHVFVKELGASNVLRLDTTAASHSEWEGHEAVTNSVIQLSATASSSFNAIGKNVITYAWHSVDGYSKVGSYTGNTSADGPFIYTGFRPAYTIIKRTSAAQNWVIYDNKRDPYNFVDERLYADSASAESGGGGSYSIDYLSNGFKIRTNGSQWNQGDYIYIAFAEQPFKYSNAR